MLTTQSQYQLPPRIQGLRMRLMKFNIRRIVGKQMYTSDTLSRLQRGQPDSKSEESLTQDQEMSAIFLRYSRCIASVRYQVQANC